MSAVLDIGFSNVTLPPPKMPLADSARDVLALLFDELSHGVLVINVDRKILHLNQAARNELERCGVLHGNGGELQALSPVDDKTLQAALVKAAAGKRSLIRLAASGMDLTLSVVPLGRAGEPDGQRLALFFARAGLNDSGMFAFFARSHGLTPTEEQVLVLLCRSLSTPEIAVQMKVAVSTVRSHVRSLCAKTLSGGVRELVNRVAVLPPVGPLPPSKIH
jgi:DNA-binding CsgD family transcriptional regulator